MFLKLKGFRRTGAGALNPDRDLSAGKDWMKAVEVAASLEKESGQSGQKGIANYYCELA